MNEGSSLADSVATQTQGQQSNGQAPDQGASQQQQNNQPAGDQSIDMAKIFGEDFTKDPNLAKFKTPQDVAKSYKELQALASKPRFDVPAADASPEVVAEFYKKMGVPDNAEAYGLKADAYHAEHNNEANQEFVKAIGAMALENKLTPAQAQGVHKFLDDLSVNVGKMQAENQAKEDAQLTSLFEKALPGENLDVVQQRMKTDLEKILPADMRPILADKMSNEALTALAIMEKHYRQKYGQTDNNINDPANNTGKSMDEMRTEAKDIYAKMQKVGMTDPEYKGLKERYDAIYKTIGELTNSQKR